LTLHVLRSRGDVMRHGLSRAVVSLGILNPHPPGQRVEVYDFGLGEVIEPEHVVSVADGDPARVTFAPALDVQGSPQQLAANRRRAPVRLRQQLDDVPTDFVSGFDTYAARAARVWRGHYVGMQPLLAAGVFALSTIQTAIVSALKLFAMLTPYVVEDDLPHVERLGEIVRASGAGLTSTTRGRPRWYAEYETYRGAVFFAMKDLRDDALRRKLSVDTAMPLGLGLAKLSFLLAVVGQDLGCLDARILSWALTPDTRQRFQRRIGKTDGRVPSAAYDAYRTMELRLLRDESPFFDPDDPVGLARSQWMLWESLGPVGDRTHTHEELYAAVVDGRLAAL
jgi:hypothetical protein